MRDTRSGRLTISTAGQHGELVIENTPMVTEVARVVSSAVAHSAPAPRAPGFAAPGALGFPGDHGDTGPATSQQPFPPQQFRAAP